MKYLLTLASLLPFLASACTSSTPILPTAQSTIEVTPKATVALALTLTVTPIPNPTNTSTPSPTPTPNGGGEHIIFRTVPPLSKGAFIGVIKSDGGDVQILTEDTWMINPKWSPDGNKIVAAYNDHYLGRGILYTMDVDGSNLRKFNNASGDFDWSPDSKQIVSLLAGNEGYDLFIVGANDESPYQLTHNDLWETSPAWSPDGHQIAFSAHKFDPHNPSETDDSEIYVINTDGSNLRQLTDNEVSDSSPVWSPDGKHLAFSLTQDNNSEIYVMDTEGDNIRNITNHEAVDMLASWSPDGKRIAFASQRDNLNWEIYVVDLDGNNLHNLTNDNKAVDYSPVWSPDGTQIAFSSYDRNGHQDSEIYVINADGSNVHRLTHSEYGESEPVWQPSH